MEIGTYISTKYWPYMANYFEKALYQAGIEVFMEAYSSKSDLGPIYFINTRLGIYRQGNFVRSGGKWV